MSTVMFTGPRRGPCTESPLIPQVVHRLLSAGRSIAVGCASGVDQAVITTILDQGAAKRLTIFCAYGASGAGWIEGCSAPYELICSAKRLGATVNFWAGGAPGLPESGRGIPPAASRLARRSMACVISASGPKGAIIGFVSGPPKEAFSAGAWPSCGSGTWASLAAADKLNTPTIIFPVSYRGTLPQLTTFGQWETTATSDLWAASQRWTHFQGSF